MSFVCHQCGQVHDGIPFAYSAEAPSDYHGIPESLRSFTVILLPEQCVIGEDRFYVRGCLEIPIIASKEIFSWGVWISLCENDFNRMAELSGVSGRELEPAYHGSLNTELPFYPDTLSLKAIVRARPIGQRPLVELDPSDHPLSVEQRTGISIERAHHLAEMIEHRTTQKFGAEDPKNKRPPWWRFFWK